MKSLAENTNNFKYAPQKGFSAQLGYSVMNKSGCSTQLKFACWNHPQSCEPHYNSKQTYYVHTYNKSLYIDSSTYPSPGCSTYRVLYTHNLRMYRCLMWCVSLHNLQWVSEWAETVTTYHFRRPIHWMETKQASSLFWKLHCSPDTLYHWQGLLVQHNRLLVLENIK